MVKMIAKTRFTYAGVNLRAGDPFDAKDKDGKLLHAIKRADFAPSRPILREKPVEVVLTEVAPSLDEQIAAAVADEEPVKAAPAKKRAYKRKDMVAE